MSILVDTPRWPKHNTMWAHLVSDENLAELHAFADGLRIPRRAFDLDHYDVPQERMADILAAGAQLVDSHELTRRLIASGLRVTTRERRALGHAPH